MLEAASTVANDTGGRTTTWAPAATVWGRVRALRGTEPYLLGALQGQLAFEVAIRWRAGVGPQSRITWDGRVLLVESVVPDQRERFLTLLCREERVEATS